MAKKKIPINGLAQFLPPNTLEKIAPYFSDYNIHLAITQDRATILGNYRNPTPAYPAHRISVNGSLNPYSFLITLLHEIAHMLVYIRFQHHVLPHGKEWQNTFGEILKGYIGQQIFPKSVEQALINSINNISAATCSNPILYKALKQYDQQKEAFVFVEALQPNQQFMIKDGRKFEMVEKRRTRYKCREISTGHYYLFPGLAEVKAV